jgi:hypothetical protein
MLTEEQEIDILIKYQDGVQRERIAREVGCGVSTVAEVIRRGCTRRIWREKHGNPRKVAAYFCTGCRRWVTWEPCQVCRARRGVDKPR